MARIVITVLCSRHGHTRFPCGGRWDGRYHQREYREDCADLAVRFHVIIPAQVYGTSFTRLWGGG